ncbi:hypothetical protein [Palleronia pelagia]|uniref:VIT family protein n=1 Tax=Palleronia pelagia TaxID=387096 RepID=A0A1H8BG05_9RHOB|nr:hypothetical protein [Palleronia pelagia]SEM80928.1 hypothetical protein SAMN04488011_101554 [Palleronia pelagia]
MAHSLETGARRDRHGWRAAWKHSFPTLAVANVPTLLFLVAASGFLTVESTVGLSQIFCVALLAILGARTGWKVDASARSALLGAFFAGGVGLALAFLKFAIH